MGQPTGSRRELRRLAPYARGQRKHLLLALGAALLGGTCSSLIPMVQREALDHLTAHGAQWLAALLALGALVFWTQRSCLYREAKAQSGVQYGLRTAMHESLQRLDAAGRGALPPGQLVSRLNSDAGLFARAVGALPHSIGILLQMAVSAAFMVAMSPVLALAAAVTVPGAVLLSRAMGGRLALASRDAQQAEGELTQRVDQAVSGVRVVKAFGREQHETQAVSATARRLYEARMRVVRLRACYEPLLGALPVLGQVAVVAFGGWLALHHRISVGTLLAFSAYLVQLATPARTLADALSAVQRARAGAGRVLELLDAVPEVTDRPGAAELAAGEGELVLDDVAFGYLPGRPVLDGFSLRVAPGETVALVGASGSGKSTAALLTARLHDVRGGAVRVDGTDVRDVTLESLRRRVGVVFQDAFLFSGTVRENVAFGRPDATDAQIAEAARAAGALDFVTALPDGWDTPVGERGTALSGGQRQRIALARALLTDPRVLVLDDVTSAVDAATEQEMTATLRTALRGRTVLLVTHRRTALALADRIAVADGGRIVDTGSHEELAARCAPYRELVAAWERGESAAEPAPAAEPQPQNEALAEEPEVPAEAGPFGLRRFLAPYRRALAVALLLVGLEAAASVLGPWLSRSGVDHGVLAGSREGLVTAVTALAVVAVGGILLSAASAAVTGRTGQRLVLALRVRVWSHLQRLSVDHYERHRSGHLLTRVMTDVDAFSALFSDGLANAVVSGATFLGILGAMLVMSPTLTAAVAVVLVPFVAATWLFQRLATAPYRRAREVAADANSAVQENLAGARESQMLGQQRRQHSAFRRLTADYLDARLDAQKLVALYFPFVELLGIAAAVIVLGVGSMLVRDGSATLGELVAFLLYLDLFFAPVQRLASVFDDWQQVRISLGRLRELLAEQPSVAPPARPVRPAPGPGRVELAGVRFGYGDTEVLHGVDLVARPGETLALVGPSGAGKSTVVRLLTRFHDPGTGAVRLDGTDLRDLAPDLLHARIGYVPQEPFLFAGTVRDNIAYGRPGATEAEVSAAVRAAGAGRVVDALPGGLEHRLGEDGGASLSAGERQLLCLARALLTDPKVLVLDEATAGLDPAAEARVLGAMRSAGRGRTTVVVAHRLAVARSADRIAVLDGGVVVECGTHEELLAEGGHYAALCSAATVAV
ncbi:ABC transporter ATP-binding protein [Streptomyces sp. NPDC001262]|uniref:ABC transporter ATP-binding protein n=1 Tax=Streptomyces sp. NPDC001262 TaxID=3364552 RepID=UPI0036AA92D9